MKKVKVEKILIEQGWWKLREGANHEIWTNGDFKIQLPRHKVIVESTARKIIKRIKKCYLK